MKQQNFNSNHLLEKVGNLNNVSIDQIASAIGCKVTYAKSIAKIHNVLIDSENNIPGNIMSEFLVIAYKNLPFWVISIKHKKIKKSRLRLKLFRALCLYLIEESNFLMNLEDDERTKCREEISSILVTVDDYLKAEKLMEPGYFCNPESYIEKIMTKMQKTGYIHNVEETFRIMFALFRIMPELMNDKMSQLIDILLMGNINDWQKTELRLQLMKLLDHYINTNRDMVDKMADFESKHDQELLTTIIKAVAMQLYLYDSTIDNIDYAQNRSMFYRYASHTNIAGNNVECLLDKAYGCVVGSIDCTTRLEYNWNQIQNLSILVTMLINTKTETRNSETIEYSTDSAIISCSSTKFEISENTNQKSLKTLGIGIIPWHKLKINVASEPSVKASSNTSDVEKLQRWWVDIDKSLNEEKITNKKPTKRRAYQEENVDIVIDGLVDPDKGIFSCHIHSDSVEGSGTIALYDIVNYKIHPEAMMNICNKAFISQETGKPYLYEASVLSDNGSNMTFTMRKRLNEYIVGLDDICFGYDTNCVITALNIPGQVAIGVSSDGIPVLIPYEESIMIGDYYDIKVTEVKNKKQGVQLMCEKVKVSENKVTQDEAFTALMQDYGIEDDEVQDVEEKVEVKKMSESAVKELIKLLDRESLLQKDVHRRYNYLYAAKLFAHIIKDEVLCYYYQNRINLQKLLYDFSKNSSIDRNVLKQLETMNSSIKAQYPILRARIEELHILECLDNSEANATLFANLQTQTNNEVKKLTNLVLAYNHLAGFELQEQRSSILSQINELLNVKIEMPETQYFGEENDQTEFKSSVVYVANSEGRHIANIEEQTNVILKEICAFLNTKGGTLYIGVNDYGYAQGLDTDMKWFDQHRAWRVTNIDEYRQFVVNILCRKWPNLKDIFEVTFPTIKGRSVVKVSVPPCKIPVSLDGAYYTRVGSECRKITDEGLSGFIERRPIQFEQFIKNFGAKL